MGLTQKLGTIPLAILTDASNNVGIGAAPSGSYKFEVTGTGRFTSTLLVGGAATFSSNIAVGSTLSSWGSPFAVTQYPYGSYSGGTTSGAWVGGNNNYYDGSVYKYALSDYATLLTQGGGDFYIRTAPSGTAGNTITWTERFRVTNGGNVGIGTSSPNFTLHIDSNTATTRFQITNSTTGQGGSVGFQLLQIANDTTLTNRSNGYMAFETVGTERLRITSGGVTLFGGTTFTTITSAVLGATNSAFTGRNWSFGPNSSGDYVVYHNQGGANTGVYLSYGGSSWTSNSDENIKDIIEVIPNALESIINFRAVKFYWKGDETKKENIGLIAQDVEKSYPQLIDKQIFGDKEILGVRYTELIPVLVKAIQEMNTKLDEQNQIIQELNERLNKAGL